MLGGWKISLGEISAGVRIRGAGSLGQLCTNEPKYTQFR